MIGFAGRLSTFHYNTGAINCPSSISPAPGHAIDAGQLVQIFFQTRPLPLGFPFLQPVTSHEFIDARGAVEDGLHAGAWGFVMIEMVSERFCLFVEIFDES